MEASGRHITITCRGCNQKILQPRAWATRDQPFNVVCSCGWSICIDDEELLRELAAYQSRYEAFNQKAAAAVSVEFELPADMLIERSTEEQILRLKQRLFGPQGNAEPIPQRPIERPMGDSDEPQDP